MPDTLVVCFTLNHQSIKGTFAIAQSVREQRPDIRIFPLPTRIDGSEEKLLNRMKDYAATLFTPLLDKKIEASEYWFKMEVPYFPRYAYAEKLSLFEEQASITASMLPAMERLSDYLTDGSVRSAEQLPFNERLSVLACFEEIDETKIPRPIEPTGTNEPTPVGVFISCAPDDYELAVALRESIKELGTITNNAIRVFLSRRYTEAGIHAAEATKKELEASDFFIVIDTGTTGRSHSYTGFEAGYFSAIIGDEAERRRPSGRRTVYLALDPQRPVTTFSEFINIGIDGSDLRGERDEYTKKWIGEGDDPLVNLFEQMVKLANARRPDQPPLGLEMEMRRLVTDRVVTPLRGAFFDSLKTKVSRSIEESRVEIELPYAPQEQPLLPSLPPGTKLTFHSRAAEILGVRDYGHTGTWGELSKTADQSSSAMFGLEQLAISATSSVYSGENVQIIRSVNGHLYSAVATRRSFYFDGRILIEIYLIEKTTETESEGAMASALIDRANKLRSILESPGARSFQFESSRTRFQSNVRQFIQRLSLLEGEALAAEDYQSGMMRLVRGDTAMLLQNLAQRYEEARQRLRAAADEALGASSDSHLLNAKQAWLEALESFKVVSGEIISTVTVAALAVLQRNLVETSRESVERQAGPS